MKNAWLLSLVMCCASWTLGSSFAPPAQQTSTDSNKSAVGDPTQNAERAASPDGGNRQKNRNSFEGPQEYNTVSKKNRARSPAPTVKVHYNQLQNNRQFSQRGKTANLRPSGSDKSGAVAKGGLIQHKAINCAPPFQSANVMRHTAPSHNNVRHHGSNSAVVGGSAISSNRNTPAINGTTVQRRP
jgi:hypothetical protein